jgi:hypothetical protein
MFCGTPEVKVKTRGVFGMVGELVRWGERTWVVFLITRIVNK